MASKSIIFVTTVDFVIMLISIPANIFILMVIILDVANSNRILISYQLICGISIINIIGQVLHICEDILDLINNNLFSVATAGKLIFAFNLVCYLCNAYFSTLLCLHFCLKIVNINQKIYIYVQKIFHRRFNWILISTVVGSVAWSLISIWSKSKGSPFNNTLSEDMFFGTMYNKLIIFPKISGIPILLPFIVLSFSAFTVIISLFKHMKNVKNNDNGLKTPSVEVHLKAIQTIMSFLTINLISVAAGSYYLLLSIRDIYQYVSCTSLTIYYVFTPIILIQGNRKLEKTFYKLFKVK